MFFLFRNGGEANSMWPASACGNWSGMNSKSKKYETYQKPYILKAKKFAEPLFQ